jgi:hypothetical protein
MKKLRNNIYNSGFKEQNKRYTRTLEKDNKYILWSHIYSVYERDKKRRLYATDLHAAHVNLDSLSKMRVKLAVKTLSGKVREEMAKYENSLTQSTQEYIRMCETLWSVFNDSKPIRLLTDHRITQLTEVLDFFTKWKQELSGVYKTKSEVSDHFITWQTMFDIQVLYIVYGYGYIIQPLPIRLFSGQLHGLCLPILPSTSTLLIAVHILHFQVSINGLKGLLEHLNSEQFTKTYGNLYIIPKKISQDIVESFFSLQRQMCGGSRNMTGFTYGYNVNGLMLFRHSKLVSNKQTNVYEVEECFKLAENNECLSRRGTSGGFAVRWTVEI